MAQYDVYRGWAADTFLVDVQSNLLDELSTRVVIPLLPADAGPQKVKRLYPQIKIEGRDYILATSLLASVSVSALQGKKVNLLDRHDEISDAIHMLIHGF